MPSGDDGLNVEMTGGLDGTAPADGDYVGTDLGPGNRTGIQALNDIDQISIVAVPGADQPDRAERPDHALRAAAGPLRHPRPGVQPEQRPGRHPGERGLVRHQVRRPVLPLARGARPAHRAEIVLPPSGHVVGIYARTDIERGVHKAPANEVVRGITGLELTINKGEQDILNPTQHQRASATSAEQPRHPRLGRALPSPATRPGSTSTCGGCSSSSRSRSTRARSGWSSSRTTSRCGRGCARRSPTS